MILKIKFKDFLHLFNRICGEFMKILEIELFCSRIRVIGLFVPFINTNILKMGKTYEE